jgi:anti-sigma factor RsiW
MTGQHRAVTETEINAYVDGELAPAERAELDELLAAAPAQLAATRELGALNDALKARYADTLAAPLPAAIEVRIARFGRSRPDVARRFVRAAAAVLVVLGAASAGYAARALLAERPGAEAAFVTTALEAHSVYVPEVRHPVEVKADEAHLVRWLAKRVGADVRAPALASLGWKLMGGRLLPDQEGHAAAQFMYEDATGRRLTLYMRKETDLGNTSFRFFERDGFGAFYWIDRPLAYALSGRLSRADLMALANAVYGQLDERRQGSDPARPAPGN